MRKPKTNRVARTRAGGEWTEAQFWAFIRSGLRKLSQKWPPIVRHAFNSCRRPSQSKNKRLKWEHQCDECKNWFPRKEVQADHIEPCGSLKSFDDIPRFVERLLCELSGIRVLCVSCHKAKTQLERTEKDNLNE
jgi:hypothetical protein